ncbi:site-2 protease family protein [Virgibacillus kekensis]|uniref:Site-2 protease family protein n=1 Tax=Virgibacillus kekensis TaxID=202261 RepID=A0ABV9DFE0_9BACI
MDIYLLIYLIFCVAPIGTLLHEAGHAAGARALNARRIQLSVGSGKEISRFSVGRLTISIHAVYFLGGMAYSERNRVYTKLEKIWIAVSGPLSNLIVTLLLFFLYTQWSSNYLLLPLLFNLWIATINLIPFKIKGRQSDGYVIFKTLSRH